MSITLECETESLLERRAAQVHREKSELANSLLRAHLEDEEDAEELAAISAQVRSGERSTVSWSQLKEELDLED